MDHSALATARQIVTVLGIDLDQVRPAPRPLRDILDAYISDLVTRAAPTHCANVRARLRWLIDELCVAHVHELQPHTLLLHRAQIRRALEPRSPSEVAALWSARSLRSLDPREIELHAAQILARLEDDLDLLALAPPIGIHALRSQRRSSRPRVPDLKLAGRVCLE